MSDVSAAGLFLRRHTRPFMPGNLPSSSRARPC